jgi:hypothetical protein
MENMYGNRDNSVGIATRLCLNWTTGVQFLGGARVLSLLHVIQI